MKGVFHAKLILVVLAGLVLGAAALLQAQTTTFRASDPGGRGGDPGAGGPIDGLTTRQGVFFDVGLDEFKEVDPVDEGLGPRMNLDSCGGCHAQPATGGTSPSVNPQFAFTSVPGGDSPPFFITESGPVREARFKFNPDGTRDGGVHNTATITGREGADCCKLAQPNFDAAARANNLIFRIPTPLFGAGLIEQIPDRTIEANQAANAASKQLLGIGGRPNRIVSGRAITGSTNNNGNDGTIARFGWKAQNQSLLLFSGEAYNVEMGITNELFPIERDETGTCQFAMVPNNVTPSIRQLSAIENFANFQRFLAPPTPVSSFGRASSFSVSRGRQRFTEVGCALCHTPALKTDNSSVAALRYQNVNLFSDLALHGMGPGLADDILQGAARGDEFRTSPLWGLGQRIFFLHDGRTNDLLEAIR